MSSKPRKRAGSFRNGIKCVRLLFLFSITHLSTYRIDSNHHLTDSFMPQTSVLLHPSCTRSHSATHRPLGSSTPERSTSPAAAYHTNRSIFVRWVVDPCNVNPSQTALRPLTSDWQIFLSNFFWYQSFFTLTGKY